MIRWQNWIVVVTLALVAAGAIGNSDPSAAQIAPSPSPDSQIELLEVPEPDLARVDPPVLKQIRASQAALAAAISQADASRARRAEAFGGLGEVYEAYDFDDAALACYANATRLDPQSFRWSYYLGYLHQSKGNAEMAMRDYQHALSIKPTNNPTLLRLGSVELTLNHPDAAKHWFTKAMAQRNPSAAALVGLGKVALVEHQYRVAVKNLTLALTREPKASSIHYQLAMAYRGLGDLPHMQEQLQARGDVEPTIADPLLDDINALKQSRSELLNRAGAAMHESRFADAIALYRQLVRLDPSEPIAYKYLAIALARSGKSDEALKEYAHALQLDPSNAGVYCDIGALLIEAGRQDQAVAQFQRALELDPALVTAHFELANLFMREKKDADAEREYGIVVSLEPQNGFARLMQAMAAVHSGSYARARTLLEDAATAIPTDAAVANALARLLAAAPDPAVRDQGRALGIIESLVQNREGDSLEEGITLAMALAAVGRFREAAACQLAIIQQLEASQHSDIAHLLRADLVRYQQGKASHMPWTSDDPVFTPVLRKIQLPVDSKRMAVSH